MVFSNPEEELIVGESELCIDYDVSSETSNDIGGNWTDGVEMTPWRRWDSKPWVSNHPRLAENGTLSLSFALILH